MIAFETQLKRKIDDRMRISFEPCRINIGGKQFHTLNDETTLQKEDLNYHSSNLNKKYIGNLIKFCNLSLHAWENTSIGCMEKRKNEPKAYCFLCSQGLNMNNVIHGIFVFFPLHFRWYTKKEFTKRRFLIENSFGKLANC